MGRKKNSPFSGNHNDLVKHSNTPFDTFFILKRNTTTNESFHTVSPFLVEKAITATLGITKSTRKLRSGDLLIEIATRQQAQQIIHLKYLDTIPVTVSAHATLNSSKGVISCGELLHVPMEEVLKGFQPQGTVRPYIPNPLRCYKCQRFGHSKASCRGTLTCARCAEAGRDSSDCTASEKCVNCKGSHTSFSRSCSAWKFEKEVIAEKVKRNISFLEARRLVKSRTPAPGTSYASAVGKKPETTSTHILPTILPSVPFKASYTPSEICPRSIDPALKLSLADTHKATVSSQFKFPESNKNPPDFSDFTTVTNRKKLKKDSQVYMANKTDNVSQIYKTPQLPDKEKVSSLKLGKNSSRHVSNSVINDSTTSRVHSVDTELLPMAVLPPLEKMILQSRGSDADAEMSSSSASEGDTLEYDMSEDLEDTPENVCSTTPPPPSTADFTIVLAQYSQLHGSCAKKPNTTNQPPSTARKR
ncbi:hypothetical protein AVEN_42945-1 [Araneus ventricosus]|uniref:CCHC-type domain-containing protein n=1 Tax=Araneus ventricosus TaxID=182803 RepID=A0A4Y2AF48_ARAVE|nr:hypothetical protein AVEN_42945-1 [Araneus ventricosus]